MSFVEVIAAKRDGRALSAEQIRRFVCGAATAAIAPEQSAALLMAICCRGMTAEETADLTREMLRSGAEWDLASDCPGVVDKHSTGGVGDTVSLVLAPLLAAVGVPVAMMAGRGLGHSQGTLDKLEAIPGFRVHWDRAGALHLIDRCGAAIVAQTADVAPADRVLYALRDVTATVPSLPLIVGSIMSKKLALGAAALILDVKWGRGAFRKTVPEAVELALALRDTARAHGRACEAVISDMNQPLAPCLGTANEVRAAVAVLSGAGDPMLRELSLELSVAAMELAGTAAEDARTRLRAALDDGSALRSWEQLVSSHGGDPDPDRLPRPTERIPVTAERAGWVQEMAAEKLGWLAVELGAGRRSRSEPIDFGGGLVLACRMGEHVEKGEPLAFLELGQREVDVEAMGAALRAALPLGDEPTAPPPLILGPVDSVRDEIAEES